MGPQAEDYIETVLTCEGDYYDPEFHTNLQMFSKKLEELILQDKKKKKLILKKVEPWNSVKVTFNIPKEAALRLKCLAEQGDSTLKELGILAVEIEGDRKISLKIAGKNNETTELVFRTNLTGASATVDISKSEDVPSGSSRKNVPAYLGQPSSVGDVLEPSDHVGSANRTQGSSYFGTTTTTPQVSPKFPTPPPSVSTPSSPSAKGHHSGGHMLGPTSQSTVETMVKLLSNKTSVTSPLLVDLLQNELMPGGAHSMAFSQALNSVLPQTFNNVVPQTFNSMVSQTFNNVVPQACNSVVPQTAASKMSFPMMDEGLSLQPPAKKKRKVRKPKERDNSKIKKEKREQETKNVIQNILNQAVSAGVQQDRVPPILNEQFSLLSGDSSDKGSSTQHSSRAVTPAKSPVPKSPMQLSVAPGQRHIINPITGQLELVDDDTTPPKMDSLHENKGHLMSGGLISPKGRNIVPSYNRSPGKGQYGKHSPVVYERVVPNSPRSSPPVVSLKNDYRDLNTLATHCDQKPANMDLTFMSHKVGETSFMQPSTCVALSSTVQSPHLKPTTSGNVTISHTSAGDVTSANISMSQTISAILSNVSRSGGLALATLNPPMHDSLLNAGTSMQNPSGHAVSTDPFNVHSSSFVINTPAVSNINPSDLVSFPHKDSTTVLETIRQSTIPSVLLEADSSGDSNTSVHQAGLGGETQSSSFGIHGIKQTQLHASHLDNTGSSLSQVQGAIHVNNVEGPKENSVHVNSSVSSSTAPVSVSTPLPSVNVQALKLESSNSAQQTAVPPMSSKPNGTSRFLNQVQHKSSGDLLNHDSELSSHSSDDHVKQGSIDSGLGLGDIKVNSGESPSGSSGNDSPGITSSSGNRDSDSEKDRDFSLSDKQNVITIGYVLSKEEHPPSKRDLLDHLEKYSQNNLQSLKESPLTAIESNMKASNDSLMKLPTLIKLQDIPYTKADNQIISDKTRLSNSLDETSPYNQSPESKNGSEKPFENISLQSETAKTDGDVVFAEDRSSMVQVCSNDSEVLSKSQDTEEECSKGLTDGVSSADNLQSKPASPDTPTPEEKANSPHSEVDSTSSMQILNSPAAQDSLNTEATPTSGPSNGSIHEIHSYSNSQSSDQESQVITADLVDKSSDSTNQSPKSSCKNSAKVGSDTTSTTSVTNSNTIISVSGGGKHAPVTQVASKDGVAVSVSMETQVPCQILQLSPKAHTVSKALFVPVNSNNNITLSALDKHLIQPVSSGPLFDPVNHQTPLLSVPQASPFKGQGNYAAALPGGFFTATTSTVQPIRELLVPVSSVLQIPIQPVILHSPLAKGYVASPSSLTAEKVSVESSINFSKQSVSNTGQVVVVSSSSAPSGKIETADTKHLFSTLATTVSYTQAGMSTSLGIGILPITSLTSAQSESAASRPVMTPSLANIPLFSKCTSTTSLKPGHRAMASLGPSPIMSTGLPYLSTPTTSAPRALTPPADVAGDGKLPKGGGGIPKGISIMKPLRDRESTMEEDLLESPIRDKKSPRKTDRSEKAVFHKRGNFTVAQLLDEAEKAKQSQALFKPCITSDNNENLSKTLTPIVNATCIPLTNAHIPPKAVEGTIDNFLNSSNISTSSGSKSVPNVLQTTNLTKTEDLTVVVNASVEAPCPNTTQPVVVNAQNIKTVVSQQSLIATTVPITGTELLLVTSDEQKETVVNTNTPKSPSPNLVSLTVSNTSTFVVPSQTRSQQANDLDSCSVEDQTSQPKTMLSLPDNNTVRTNERNQNIVKVVTKNSFKGEFLKLGTGTTSDCSNVKIEPANPVIKEKSSSSPSSEKLIHGALLTTIVETESSEPNPATSTNSAVVVNSPTNGKSELLPSTASLVDEHSYSVSPHKSVPSDQTTKERKPSGGNNIPSVLENPLVSESQDYGCVLTEELELDLNNPIINSVWSSQSNELPTETLCEVTIPDSGRYKNQGIDVSKPVISPVNADSGKTLLFVGKSGSRDPTKVTLDLRSAVTQPPSFTKFIKLEPGCNLASKSVNKLTSNITVKVSNDVSKADGNPLVQQSQNTASTSKVSHSNKSEMTHVKCVEVNPSVESVDNLVNDVGDDVSLPRGPHISTEKMITSRRKSASEFCQSPLAFDESPNSCRTLHLEGSSEPSDDFPGKVTRRASRGSSDSKASSTDGTAKLDDPTAARLNLRGRTKRVSETSESGNGQELSLSGSGSLESSALLTHSTKPARSSRRKERNAVQEPFVVMEQQDGQQSRATRSSKRKNPTNEEREDGDQVKKMKLENCTGGEVLEMMSSMKEASPDSDRKIQARGRLGRNKGNLMDLETEDGDKHEETSGCKRSTRSAHSVEHCELPNNYTTKKKQKSH